MLIACVCVCANNNIISYNYACVLECKQGQRKRWFKDRHHMQYPIMDSILKSMCPTKVDRRAKLKDLAC